MLASQVQDSRVKTTIKERALLKYFFYDMDDTLIKTRKNWLGAIQEYLSLQDISWENEDLTRYLGKNCRDICLEILSGWGYIEPGEIERHAGILRQCLLNQFEQGVALEIPGASLFLETMTRNVEQYVVSGSPLQVVTKVIKEMGWSRFIDGFLSSESVEKGKPDPRIYDGLRRKLNAKKEECLIFEDSPAGIEAARRAGIRCIGINVRLPIGESDPPICKVPNFQALLIDDTLQRLVGSELRQKTL
ncbi:Phosphoglycolate phosphatase [bioreactor metagenome]|uniref:HAD-superfamily hydrolase, subfamily IA, variant 3 n=2 Tax=root TaxID=1 RepID=A0A652ZTN9_9SPIR|nr:hypothetical protein TRIP_E190044 [uncultured Spirochaetota bacterium]